MTLQQMIYFKEVAQTLHFTRAAENQYVSQSSLSHAILTMERELGVPLFIRKSGKKLKLSRFGDALLPYVNTILKTVESAEASVQKMRNPMSGVVTIAYSYLNGYSLVPSIFNAFYESNENEDITLNFDVEHNTKSIENRILEGEIDLAINCTTGVEGVSTYRVARQELMVALPAAHPLAKRDKLVIPDLMNEQITSYHPSSSIYRTINKMFQEYDLRPNIQINASDWSVQLANVALGIGIAIVPHVPVDERQIKLVALDHPLHKRSVYLLWATNKKLSPAVEYVKQYCISYARKGGRDE